MNYQELEELNRTPLLVLLEKAHEVHRRNWPDNEVQVCTLLSIKTGGCSEDCAYCAQSAHYSTGVKNEGLLPREVVLERALLARETGSTRFCMGAAWRGISRKDKRWPEVLEIVRAVSALGLEVCATLGKLGLDEARELKAAGLDAYNHNLDTSPEYYPSIVSTHTYQERLDTIRNIQDAGISVCCGGIIGLGEKQADRLRLLEIVSSFNPHPESFPINALISMPGTPMEERNDDAPVDCWDFIRMCAMARIALPKTRVRMSAGRGRLSHEAQALCFYAGANSLFYGDKLLTAKNAGTSEDLEMIRKLGLNVKKPDPSLMAPLPDAESPLFPEHEPHPCTTPGPCREA